MYYSRLELRFLMRGWTGGQLLEGVVAGAVRGVALELASRQIEYTLVQPKRGVRSHDVVTHSAGTARTVLPAGLVRLTARTRVVANTTPVGWVSRIWCDRHSRELTHLLVQMRHALLVRPVERIVAASYLDDLRDSRLMLKLSPADFAGLPQFRLDAAILADLRLAFEAALPDPRTRRAVKLRVEDGQVALGGEVDTPEQRDAALRAATAVSGVRGVVNDLVIAESVAGAVEAALKREISSRSLIAAVQAYFEHGIVYLEGHVRDARDRDALEQTAVGVAGVRVVVNDLVVEGEFPSRASDTGPLTRNR
jgi:osmotically-inducible protein OsmY